jgi:hypothetical protein
VLALISQAPVSRIVVVVSYAGWEAPVAVAGLVLAMLSLLWQGYTFARSGSRVRVEAKFGTFISELLPGLVPDGTHFFLSDEILAAMKHQGFPGVMLIAIIQNVGRQAVTVQGCMWQTRQEKFGNLGNPLGASFPHRLEPDAQCLAVVDLATALAVLDAPLRDTSTGRQVWPVVELGNGTSAKGKPIEIPAADRNGGVTSATAP